MAAAVVLPMAVEVEAAGAEVLAAPVVPQVEMAWWGKEPKAPPGVSVGVMATGEWVVVVMEHLAAKQPELGEMAEGLSSRIKHPHVHGRDPRCSLRTANDT